MVQACSETSRRYQDHPIRLTLAAELGGPLDGAWWPYTSAMARELPYLVDALHSRLGKIVDIAINWSPLHGDPDLAPAASRALKPLPGHERRDHRVIRVTGAEASANLLVVPSRTARALAVMVLRHAAALPIRYGHIDTVACRTAAEIVDAARTECERRGAVAPAAGAVLQK